MGKKVLFITFFFPPYNCIGAVRTGYTVKLLRDMGYEVRVISANEQKLPRNLKIDLEGVSVRYTDWMDVNAPIYKVIGKQEASIKAGLGSSSFKFRVVSVLKAIYAWFFHTPDQHVGWYWAAKKACSVMIEEGWKPDVIFSSAQPYTSHLVARSIAEKYKLPWVAELRDLWKDNHYRASGLLDAWLERRTLSRASVLVTVSKPLQERLGERYDIPVHVVQNGYDEPDSLLEERKAQDDLIHIVYTGSVYQGRQDPTPLFQALSRCDVLKEKTRVDFYGKNLTFIKALVNQYDLEGIVKVHEPIAREKALAIQKTADVLLLLTWNSPQEKGILTGKLFEYIAAGNAILSLGAVHDDASRIVVDNNFGIASNNPEDIIDFLMNFYEGKYNNSSEKRAKYKRDIQVRKLASIFDKCCA